MADLSVQFNALPEEILDFVQQMADDHGLHVARITFPPYRGEEVSLDSLASAFANPSKDQTLFFTLGAPSFPGNSSMDFYDMNQDALRLNIGKFDKQGLRESHLSARTSNTAAMAVWKKIAKRLKAITKQGATATNPKTGHTGPAPWQRFTEGAVKTHKAGIPLLTVTGIQLTPSVKDGDHAGPGSP
jgi:hypothetical protein